MSLAQVGCLCLQAASAQTADPIEDAAKAARPGVLVRASFFGSADGGLCLLVQDEPLENEAPAKTANRCVWLPAPGRIWTNESEDWLSMRWKQHSKLSKQHSKLSKP